MPLVSVIIPTYNRPRRLDRAVSSVLGQSFKDYELFVIDDGSTRPIEATLAPYGNHLTLLKHSANFGVSAARNTGIKASTAPLIAFLDSDDFWLPNKLDVQVAFFDARPDALACQTQEIWVRNGRRVNPKRKHLKPSGDIFEPSLRLCLVSPSAVMLKRRLLEEVGPFDAQLPVCEDYDLWLRISCRYPVFLIDRPLVVKEGGHCDQLSSQYWGMDRFRIRILEKLIMSGRLNERQLRAAFEEVSLKCRIFAHGCIKRGRLQEGRRYQSLPDELKKRLSKENQKITSQI